MGKVSPISQCILLCLILKKQDYKTPLNLIPFFWVNPAQNPVVGEGLL